MTSFPSSVRTPSASSSAWKSSANRSSDVLDEVTNIAPLPGLDVLVSTGAGHGVLLVSTGAGHGVQLLTILQDVAQAYDRWGR